MEDIELGRHGCGCCGDACIDSPGDDKGHRRQAVVTLEGESTCRQGCPHGCRDESWIHRWVDIAQLRLVSGEVGHERVGARQERALTARNGTTDAPDGSCGPGPDDDLAAAGRPLQHDEFGRGRTGDEQPHLVLTDEDEIDRTGGDGDGCPQRHAPYRGRVPGAFVEPPTDRGGRVDRSSGRVRSILPFEEGDDRVAGEGEDVTATGLDGLGDRAEDTADERDGFLSAGPPPTGEALGQSGVAADVGKEQAAADPAVPGSGALGKPAARDARRQLRCAQPNSHETSV